MSKGIKIHNTLGVPCLKPIKKQNLQEKIKKGCIIRKDPKRKIILTQEFYPNILSVGYDPQNNLEDINKLSVEVENLPIHYLLEITNKCNCHCNGCYINQDLNRLKDPSLKKLKERILKIRKLGGMIIEVTGGECTLREDLEEIVSEIESNNLYYLIVTNGSNIEHLNDILKGSKKLLGVAISLDGSKNLHNKIRGYPGLYEKILEGISKLKENGIKLSLVATIKEENILEIQKLVKLGEDYRTQIHIRPIVKINKTQKPILVDLPTSPYLIGGFIAKKTYFPEASFYGCSFRFRIGIDPEGNLVPCVMNRTIKLGKIIEYNQLTLVKTLERLTRENLNKILKCRSCEINKDKIVCGGLCQFSNKYKELKNQKV